MTYAEPGALIAFSGPRVIEQTTREKLPADFGLAERQLEHGHVDAVVDRRELPAPPGPPAGDPRAAPARRDPVAGQPAGPERVSERAARVAQALPTLSRRLRGIGGHEEIDANGAGEQ